MHSVVQLDGAPLRAVHPVGCTDYMCQMMIKCAVTTSASYKRVNIVNQPGIQLLFYQDYTSQEDRDF